MEEPKQAPRAVDSLTSIFEILKSADGTFLAEIDYESKSVSIFEKVIAFEQLAELSTFIIGLTGRIESRNTDK